MYAAKACEPTEGLTSNTNDLYCYAVLKAMSASTPFLVSLAQWNHTDSIPNSEVKRCSGQDTLGVTPRDNSSMPGHSSHQSLFLEIENEAFVHRRIFDKFLNLC